MSYRTSLALAAALVTFVLVLIGSVMVQAVQPQIGAAASTPLAAVAAAPTAPPAAEPTEATAPLAAEPAEATIASIAAQVPAVAQIAAQVPADDPSLALLKQRELEYRQLIEQANERIKVANDRIRVANRQQKTLVDQLKSAYAKQQELARAQCTAVQP